MALQIYQIKTVVWVNPILIALYEKKTLPLPCLPGDFERLGASVVQLFEGAGEVPRDWVGLPGVWFLEP